MTYPQDPFNPQGQPPPQPYGMPPQGYGYVPPPQKKSGKGCLVAALVTLGVGLLLVIALAVVAGFGGYSVFKWVSGPIDTTNEYLAALKKGEYREAYGMICDETRQQAPFEDWRSEVGEELDSHDGIRKYNVYQSNFVNDEGYVRYSLTFGDGTSTDKTATVVEEQGDWKLCFSRSAPDTSEDDFGDS